MIMVLKTKSIKVKPEVTREMIRILWATPELPSAEKVSQGVSKYLTAKQWVLSKPPDQFGGVVTVPSPLPINVERWRVGMKKSPPEFVDEVTGTVPASGGVAEKHISPYEEKFKQDSDETDFSF